METINIITLGASGVGKTSLIKRITANTFDANYNVTIGTEIANKEKEVKNKSFKSIKYTFWDTSGQESFNSITASYIRGKEMVLFVFCDFDSLESLKTKWIKFYRDNSDIDKSKFIVVANKSDEFGDKYEEIRKLGKEFATSIDAFFITCSAKSKDNIYNLEDHIELEAIRLIEERNKYNKIETRKSMKLEPINHTSSNNETNNSHNQKTINVNTRITNKVCC